MSIKTSHVLRILRERFHAFPGLSERALVESLQVFRLFDLREGENLASHWQRTPRSALRRHWPGGDHRRRRTSPGT